MHKIAARKAIDNTNLKAMIADAVDLSAFDSNSIDVVTCCYGYMFPEDKVEVEEAPAGGVACARSPGAGKRGPSSATGILAISTRIAAKVCRDSQVLLS
jgi:hypothetical protein